MQKRINHYLVAVVLFCGCFAIYSCSKPSPDEPKDYPILKEGNLVQSYHLSYHYMDYSFTDTMVKVQPGLYTFKLFEQFYWLLDTLQLYKGSNQVYLSKRRINTQHFSPASPEYERIKKSEANYRNMQIISADSIVGEYYNTYYYSWSSREYFPDSGIIAIKILP